MPVDSSTANHADIGARGANTIRHNSDQGLWQQPVLRFGTALLKPGVNELTFTVPGGDLQSGGVRGCRRLEPDGNFKPANTPGASAPQEEFSFGIIQTPNRRGSWKIDQRQSCVRLLNAASQPWLSSREIFLWTGRFEWR